MNSFPPPNNLIEKPRTCNEAAAQLFPQPAKHHSAFTEIETGSLSEPGQLDLAQIPQSAPEPFQLKPGLPYFNFLQHEKLVSLVLQGYSREEAERLSQPKPIDMEALEERMMEEQEKQLRWLAKLSPTAKLFDQRMKMRRGDDDEIHIPWADIKNPEQLKTKDGDKH
jgi:hypothetical protein